MDERDDAGSTPEKQLLRLIEQPEGDVQKQEAIRRTGVGILSVSAIKSRVSFLKRKLKSALTTQGGQSNLKRINAVLGFCALCLIMFLLIDVGLAMAALSDIRLSANESRTIDMPEIKVGLKDKVEYTDVVRDRPGFDFSPKLLREMVADDGGAQKPPGIEKLAEGLRLVGITMPAEEGTSPECMIRDENVEKTFFLKLGDVFKQMRVAEITKERVVLRYKEEEHVLQ